jgi:hypothetical protein
MKICCSPRESTDIKRHAGHVLLLDGPPPAGFKGVTLKIQYVYTLVDPRTEGVHYVGRTCNPKKRYTQHLAATRAKDICTLEKEKWTWELRSLGLRPRMKIVETVEPPPMRVLERECRWLFHYIQQRAPLTNIEAQAYHYLVKAIRRSRANFLTAHVQARVWYPLLCAERLDLEALRRG